jgi:ribonuclease HI
VTKDNQANGEADKKKQWKPPQVGWVKLNTDAGFCPNLGKVSTGIVVRGPVGKILLTAWRTIRSCGSPEEADAEACLQGTRLAAQWIQQPAHIETDCQTLVKAIEALEPERASWAGLVEEIQAAKNLLPAYTFKHVRREDNRATHLLAQHAIRNWECVVRRFSMPAFVRRQVQAEAAGAVLNSPERNTVMCD